jgi:hypothetical protein
MAWPDATAVREANSPVEYRWRVKSGAFFRDAVTIATCAARRNDWSDVGRLSIRAASCPLSAQLPEKLMQKIHRLTDN